jgi:hypothetical protein
MIGNEPNIDFVDVITKIREDILLLDLLFLPNSPELKAFQRAGMKALDDHMFNWVQAYRGTGKCRKADSIVMLADGTEVLAKDLIGKTFQLPVLTNGNSLKGFQDFAGRARKKRDQTVTYFPKFEKGPNHVIVGQAHAEYNGVKPCYRIVTTDGLSLEITDNHPFMTYAGWTPAKDVVVGDRIAVSTNLPIEGTKRINDDIVKFLAYMLADGGTTQSATFSQLEGPVLDEFKEVCSRLGFSLKITSNSCTYRIVNTKRVKPGRSGPLQQLLSEYGLRGKHSRDKRIPKQIFECPNDQIRLFISRFMACDGYVTNSTKASGKTQSSVGLTLISCEMVKDIKRLALRLGVYGTFTEKTSLKSTADGKCWVWEVQGAENVLKYAKNIGIFGKEEALHKAVAKATGSILSKRARKHPHNNFTWSKVKSIEYIGEHPTVGISVPEHNVYLNEFVEHNTYLAARYCTAKMFGYKCKTVNVGPTFRQALGPWTYSKTLIEENYETLIPLEREVKRNARDSMRAEIELYNGSRNVALPMGASGEKIRGERADILVADEFYLTEKSMFETHVRPFLLGEKPVGSVGPKIILATSPEWQNCYAYSVFVDYLRSIYDEDRMCELDPNFKRLYNVIDIRVSDALRSGYNLDKNIMKQTLDNASAEERKQILENKWIGVTGQFMPSNLIEKMSSPDIRIENEADGNAAYTLAVDIATDPNGDFFVIHVFKMIPDTRMGFVNSFWAKGFTDDDMAWKIHQFNHRFKPQWIVMDKGGGGVYVTQALARTTLTLSSGETQKIPVPILLHDEVRKIEGQRKLVLNKVADEKIRQGFSADRERAGEYIHSEDILSHLMFTGLKKALSQENPMIIIPDKYDEDACDEEATHGVIFDNIRESINQLKSLTIETKTDGDGNTYVVTTKFNKLPSYIFKSTKKDGAMTLCYGYLSYKIFHIDGKARTMSNPAVTPTLYNQDTARFAGMVEIYPDQIYRHR